MNEKVCRGECLTRACPHGGCIKYKNDSAQANPVAIDMQILTGGIEQSGIETDKSGYGIAVDIGTTTVAVLLYDLHAGKRLAERSAVNRQVGFGLDVISRIRYCAENKDGLATLHSAIIQQLEALIRETCADASVSEAQIGHAVITGNTTMLHILTNLPPVSMGQAPFAPASLFGKYTTLKGMGLPLTAECYIPPCISAFVGADVVCGMVAAGTGDVSDYLLMDIGTNGEVALRANKRCITASTAAGPAFEGAHITCGMGGVRGAIDHVEALDGKLHYTTIGNAAPAGLAGSGLLDTVAVFLQAGMIDKTGKICGGAPNEVDIGGQPALAITKGIYITQKDIREFQTAKAALAAGVLALRHTLHPERADLPRIYIAGGFGNFINAENARITGLIPLRADAVAIGNAAVAGAALMLLNDSYKKAAKELAASAEHLELAGDAFFMEQFVACMEFSAMA